MTDEKNLAYLLAPQIQVVLTLADDAEMEDGATYGWEYGGRVPQSRVQAAEQRLAYSRRPETDIEVCSSFQSIEELARGEGIWRLLPLRERKAQIQVMIDLLEELYPTLRWFLFDGLRQYCVPLTLFGPLRAAAYFGDMYFVFNSTEHVRVLTRHFDDLIRVATVQPPDVPDFLRQLVEDLPDDRVTPAKLGKRQ